MIINNYKCIYHFIEFAMTAQQITENATLRTNIPKNILMLFSITKSNCERLGNREKQQSAKLKTKFVVLFYWEKSVLMHIE